MESLRNLGWRIFVSLFQVSVLVAWCFGQSWRDKVWLELFSLIAAAGGLLIAFQYIPRFYRLIRLKLQLNMGPSQEVQAERRRIASDLHDTLGCQLVQALSLIETHSQAGGDLAKQVLEQSLLDLRLIVDSMDAQDDNLVMRLARLRHRLEPVMRRKGIALGWHVSDPELGVGQRSGTPLPRGQTAHQILAVVQESICNAMTHANATEIRISLEPYGRGDLQGLGWSWSLCIEDNGRGFDLDSTLADASRCGHGVSNMFHRMGNIGGELLIHPRQGGGTQVLLRWRTGNELAA